MDGCRNQQWIAPVAAVFLSCVSLNTYADVINNEWYSSVRALSMGNAAIASAEDPVTAMFYNPAMIAKNKKATGELFNPQIEMGMGNFTLGKDATSLWKQGLGDTIPHMQANRDTPSYLGGSIYPNFAAQNFAIGFLARAEQGGYVDQADILHYRSRQLMMPTLALSAGALSGRFKVGVAVRAIQVTEKDTTAEPANFGTQTYQGDPTEGVGWGLDVGASLTMPWTSLPTIAVVARNIGDTSFPVLSPPFPSLGSGTPTPHDMIKSTYDVGMSFSPKLERNKSLLISMDYRDALLRHNEVNALRRLNVGVEYGANKFFYLRLGARAGYWTAGIGINGRKASLDIGTYADELDRTGFMKIEDRRIAIRYGGRF